MNMRIYVSKLWTSLSDMCITPTNKELSGIELLVTPLLPPYRELKCTSFPRLCTDSPIDYPSDMPELAETIAKKNECTIIYADRDSKHSRGCDRNGKQISHYNEGDFLRMAPDSLHLAGEEVIVRRGIRM